MSKTLTTEEFIEKARKIHGDKYDYSKVEYVNAYTKVCIICPIHGEFWQTPSMHTNAHQGCPKCANNVKFTKEKFIELSRKIHGDKYDYSKVEYVNANTKVCIICPIHGEFWQTPAHHLNGDNCPRCVNNVRLTTNEFIDKARKVHGNKYDYSKVNYLNNNTKICIICPIHGEFWQLPLNHLQGKGCKKCLNLVENTEQFIEKAKQVHGDKYDYSKVEYVDTQTKVRIICSIHGEFLQTPNNHLSYACGCPRCNSSHLENEMRKFLTENKIEFNEQQKFDWLGRQSLDFYIPSKNIAIECQGKQHFGEGGWMNGNKEAFELIRERDETKRRLCEENGVKILYYSNLGIEYPYQVFENKEEILKILMF